MIQNDPKFLISFAGAKIEKSNKADSNYKTGITYMTPSRPTCQDRSPGCWDGCLNSAGRGRFDNVKRARAQRLELFLKHPEIFAARERKELNLFIRRCDKAGQVGAYRPGGLDDTGRGEKLAAEFPELHLYDYTKNINRFMRIMGGPTAGVNPPRLSVECKYHLTFSRSETNWRDCLSALSVGNVAVVFRDSIPTRYKGFKVENGELSDLRFLDSGPGRIIGLTAKGKAKADRSGFVVDVYRPLGKGSDSDFYPKK